MKTTANLIPDDLFEKMFKDRQIRTAITMQSHLYFFNFYLPDYVKYHTAPFQKEIFALTEDENLKNSFIVAFRGSGKSTIVTTSYPLWAILGRQKKKFVLILCQTKTQAKQHMMNLRRELEDNPLLKNDLGPFQSEDDNEWGSSSLVFTDLNARITVASSEQSIRGLRHGPHRPDLIICDDVEDMASTKTREGRDKIYQWLTGEVIPAGDRNTKLVVIGNLLHEDSLLMRLKSDLEESKIIGVFKQYPLTRLDGTILWPGKYPTVEDVELEHKAVGNEHAWQREYLLRIIPGDYQIIPREWIQYHDIDTASVKPSAYSLRIGVDPAISEKETADYTAMVIGWAYKDSKIIIDSFVVNERMSFPKTVEVCKELDRALSLGFMRPEFIIEEVGYQQALTQTLDEHNLEVRGVKINSLDKRSRLNIVSCKIKNGDILFARKGCEELISQIVNFGVEKHDDMVDAFTLLVLSYINDPPVTAGVVFI